MEFKIDDAYICSVTTHKEWSTYHGRTDLTPDELVKVIKGEDRCSITSSEDHPEFAKLREELGSRKYIEIQRGWWNGDRVLKPFLLNGFLFEKDEKFPSGCAMPGHLKYMKMPAKLKK